MGARRVEDLEVWQLANDLKLRTYELIATSRKPLDFKFRSEIEDALGSATRNISEGFGRYRHKPFAQFLEYARGSVFEAKDCLLDGAARGYWSKSDAEPASALAERTQKAIARFIDYLKNNPDP
jgi:four helix bundle protein